MTARIAKILLGALFLGSLVGAVQPSEAGASIVSRGLLMRLDAKNPASYPTGSSLWKDISGNGNDVTLYNGASTTCSTPYTNANVCAGSYSETVASGVRMPAMQFYNQTTATTGKYGAVNAGGSVSWGAFNGFTISFYANFGTNSSNWDRIIDFGSAAGGSSGYNIEVGRSGVDPSKVFLETWTGAGTSNGYCATDPITNNTWAHYAIVLTATQCLTYKNGTLQSTTSYTGLPSNVARGANYIGRSWWNGDGMYSGGLADLALYNVALADTEVAQNYAEQGAAQVLSFTSTAPANAISGVGSYAVTDTSTSQLPVTTTIDASSSAVCSISNGTVTFAGGGTCTINANQPGNANYSAGTQMQQGFSITGNSSLVFTIAGNATTAIYRQSLGLTATVSPTGKVTFYQQGKAIPGCKGLIGSGAVTCNWKPAQKATITLTVKFVPTNASLNTRTAGPLMVSVGKRTGTR